MFGVDFYPTPKALIEQMCSDLELEGKQVLEPSAGSGNIVDYCVGSGAIVSACEIDENLRAILSSKSCKIVANDFLNLKKEDVSHIDFIIMNPPFSRDTMHIRHAWHIAPSGCQIVALCNANEVSMHRPGEFNKIIHDYGHYIKIQNAFSTAERKTDVEVALIHLYKPKGKSEDEFEGFFMDEDEEENIDGLQRYNFVRDVVNRYVTAIRIFDEQLDSAQRMNELTSSFFDTKIGLSLTKEKAVITREEFKKDLQKSAWQFIIKEMGMEKFSTRGLKEDLNKFVETQTKIPFTMKNVYRMIEIVIGTHGQRMDRAIIEAFDAVTKHYHDNRYGVEGWKTNSHYLLTEKFIMPWIFRYQYGRLDVEYWKNANYDILMDLNKALCFVTGTPFESIEDFHNVLRNNQYQNNEWFEWGFFKVKGFKKGTGHFKFKDREVWGLFNRNVARIKGYPLPEKL
ncbi:MAG: DUF4942 domain-containing protein [Moheibacter sp.]